MAQSRSYRHDTRCIHCGSNWIVKTEPRPWKADIPLPRLQNPTHSVGKAPLVFEGVPRKSGENV